MSFPWNNCETESRIDFRVRWCRSSCLWTSRATVSLLRNRAVRRAAWCCRRQGSFSPQALWILTRLLLKSLEGWGWGWELGIITGGCSQTTPRKTSPPFLKSLTSPSARLVTNSFNILSTLLWGGAAWDNVLLAMRHVINKWMQICWQFTKVLTGTGTGTGGSTRFSNSILKRNPFLRNFILQMSTHAKESAATAQEGR